MQPAEKPTCENSTDINTHEIVEFKRPTTQIYSDEQGLPCVERIVAQCARCGIQIPEGYKKYLSKRKESE